MRKTNRNSFRFQVFCSVVLFSLALMPLRSQGTSGGAPKASEPASVRAGGLSFRFPSPSGDLVETGPDYRVLLEPFAPNTNRLVAAFVVPDDFAAVRSAKSNAMTEYALVEIPRQAEFADVTPEIFKQVADGMASSFGANFETAMKEQEEEINRRLKALNPGPLSPNWFLNVHTRIALIMSQGSPYSTSGRADQEWGRSKPWPSSWQLNVGLQSLLWLPRTTRCPPAAPESVWKL